MGILVVILLVIATEGLVELLLKSRLLQAPREFLKMRSKFLELLLTCGYCASYWCAAFLVCLAYFSGVNLQILEAPLVPTLLLLWLVIQRGSNYLHDLRDRVAKEYVNDKPYLHLVQDLKRED